METNDTQKQATLLLCRARIPRLYRGCPQPTTPAWREVCHWLDKWTVTEGRRITQPTVVLFQGAAKLDEFFALCGALALQQRAVILVDAKDLAAPTEALLARLEADVIWCVTGMAGARDPFTDTELYSIERNLTKHLYRCGMAVLHTEVPLESAGKSGWWSESFVGLVKKFLAIKA